MTITVTEEMRAAALELRGELSARHQEKVEDFETVDIPGQVRPDWCQISEGLDQLLTRTEEQTNEP